MLPERDAQDLAPLKAELAGERVLWAGQPDSAITLRKGIGIWLFAVPWTVFSLAWETFALGVFITQGEATRTQAGGILAWVFPIFGLPFVLVGFWLLAAPFWNARKARRTVHVLTETRLVSAVLGQKFEVESVDLAKLVSHRRVESRNGMGTMTLSLGKHRDAHGDEVEKTLDWVGVPEVRALDEALRKQVQAMRGG